MDHSQLQEAAQQLLRRKNPVIELGLSAYFDEIMPTFREFCQKSSSYREAWAIDHNKEEPDFGYVRKQGGKFDHKHFLHYSRGLEGLMPQWAVSRKEKEMLFLLEEVYQILDVVSQGMFAAIDIQNSLGLLKRYLSLSDLYRIRIRLLYYEPKAKDFAKAHFDRCALTYHLWESKPALEYNDGLRYEAKSGRVLLMPGIKSALVADTRYQEGELKKILEDHSWVPDGCIFPTIHKATRSPEDTAERLTAVAFSHIGIPELPVYYSDETFSRLQKNLRKTLGYT